MAYDGNNWSFGPAHLEGECMASCIENDGKYKCT